MLSSPKYVSVILDVSIHKALDYSVPDELSQRIKKGLRVEVIVRGRIQKGYVFELKNETSYKNVLPLVGIVSDQEFISEELFELGLFMSRYYAAPLSSVFRTMLPAILRKNGKHKEQLFITPLKSKEELKKYVEKIRNINSSQADVLDQMLKADKGLLLSKLLEETKGSRSPIDTLVKKGYLSISKVRIDRSPLINQEYFKVSPKKLNPEQKMAFDRISKSIDENIFETHLLFGVTGSGKTEVYLQAIDLALKKNKGVIMLVPEISLTAQTIERFRSRFEGHIAILHHALSDGERFDEWNKIQKGEASIVIGARSAIFSPVRNLGLVIIDEEHESSYKQTDESPCYHARDIAVMRGKITHSTVILGSATPSIESFTNATSGKYTLSKLSTRANERDLPEIHVVNMNEEFEKNKGYTNFSDKLLRAIKKRIEAHEQVILFLNRRGYHTTLFCEGCELPVKCQHCDVALTFHKQEHHLSCHLCNYTLTPPPVICPICQKERPMKYKGVGTEQIEKALHAIFPDIKTVRLDHDTTRHKGSHEMLLREFGAQKADIMIGTQMIAKGLHFPNVTLVGVLNSDSGLNIPDFRASETTFQLITQVAGRAGRGEMKGEVIIQTRMPENMAITLSQKQDYENFYREEISIRKIFNYPPFCNFAKFTFSGKDQKKTLQVAEEFRLKIASKLPQNFEIHPIIPSGHAKVKDYFRFQFLIKGKGIFPISDALESINVKQSVPSSVKLLIDINPTSTFF